MPEDKKRGLHKTAKYTNAGHAEPVRRASHVQQDVWRSSPPSEMSSGVVYAPTMRTSCSPRTAMPAYNSQEAAGARMPDAPDRSSRWEKIQAISNEVPLQR